MACGERTAVTVADVLRDHAAGLHLTPEQAKVVAHILACRTGRLGGHLAVCDRCGHTHFAYHSCRDRHCPRCGSLDQALWAEAQLPHLLPVSYFHLVFTLPASLRPFFSGKGRADALDALFAAVSETILHSSWGCSAAPPDPRGYAGVNPATPRACSQAPRSLRPGVLAVLHTWTQKLTFHPHLHCLITGGGLGPDGFVHRRRYLLPLRVLRPMFKGKLLGKLQALLRERRVDVGRHSGHELLRDASRREWNIDIRRPLAGAEQVVRYFARYTRRIAISDRRLVSYDGHTVVFRWRDRADGNRQKTMALDGPTFCRRFLQHVLPPRFVRIRRYGLLANRVRVSLLARARELLGADPPLLLAPPGESRVAACQRIFKVDLDLCPKCRKGKLLVRASWNATRVPLECVLASLNPRAP